MQSSAGIYAELSGQTRPPTEQDIMLDDLLRELENTDKQDNSGDTIEIEDDSDKEGVNGVWGLECEMGLLSLNFTFIFLRISYLFYFTFKGLSLEKVWTQPSRGHAVRS